MAEKGTHPVRGVFLILIAELCFASATVIAKQIMNNSSIPAVEITFFRFFLGIPIAYALVRNAGISFKPNNLNLVLRRGILNTLAVIFFFLSVQYTTVTNANMLNMTYPVFIFAITTFFAKEKTPPSYLILLLVSMVGIFLVIHPDFGSIRPGDIIGLLSGITAAFAIITLKEATTYDHTSIILFYLMIVGTVINLILLIPIFVVPSLPFLALMLLAAVIAFAGQAFLTDGYKHVGARAGGMLSSSRIIYAVTLGALFFDDPLGWKIILGGGLIFASLLALGWRETQSRPSFDKARNR